jgi:hypothetical protein
MRHPSVCLPILHKEGWFRLAIGQILLADGAAWLNPAGRGSAHIG